MSYKGAQVVFCDLDIILVHHRCTSKRKFCHCEAYVANYHYPFMHRAANYCYYYRRTIPKKSKPLFGGMWEIKKALHTRDQKSAFVRCSFIGFQVELLFSNLHHMEMKDVDLIKSIMNGTSKTSEFELTGLKLDNKTKMLSIESLNVSDDSDQERLLKTIEALKALPSPATVTVNAPRRLKGCKKLQVRGLLKHFLMKRIIRSY